MQSHKAFLSSLHNMYTNALASKSIFPLFVGNRDVVLDDTFPIQISYLNSSTVETKKKESNHDSSTSPPWPPRDAFAFALERDVLELFTQKSETATHLILLNKYPVIQNHLVIVRKEFQRQTEPLHLADVEALLFVMRELDGLGFYNCGFNSGASQPRRHTQFIPYETMIPLTEEPVLDFSKPRKTSDDITSDSVEEYRYILRRRVPLQHLIDSYLLSEEGKQIEKNTPLAIKSLPFPHRFVFFDDSTRRSNYVDGSVSVFNAYRQCLSDVLPFLVERAESVEGECSLSMIPPRDEDDASHNVLLTNDWIFVIPRSLEETSSGISMNSLGFAGFFLVKSEEEGAIIKRDPLALLQEVSRVL